MAKVQTQPVARVAAARGGGERAAGPAAPAVVLELEPLVRRLLLAVAAVPVLLAGCDYFFVYRGMIGYQPVQRLFNMTRDDSISNWYASVVTLLTGITGLAIYAWERSQQRQRGVKKGHNWGWALLGGFLLYLAGDDGATIHERLGAVVERWMKATANDPSAGGLSRWISHYPSYGWQLLLGPICLTIGLFSFVFLWRRFRQSGVLGFLIGSALLVALSQSMDVIEGLGGSFARIGAYLGCRSYTVSHYSKIFEEMIEVWAISCLWYGLYRCWLSSAGNTAVIFARGGGGKPPAA